MMYVTDDQIHMAEANGINARAFKYRISVGWELERAMTQPLDPKASQSPRKRSEVFTLAQLDRMYANRIPIGQAINRVKQLGWTKDDAVNVPIGTRYRKRKRKEPHI